MSDRSIIFKGLTGIILFLFVLMVNMLGMPGCTSAPGSAGKANDQDWPLFRGDASLSGYTKTKLPVNPVLLWSYKSDARTASSPVVYNNIVYWCDKRGKIRGIDRQGEPVFEYELKTAVEATPMIYDSILYIGRIDGFMTALSLTRKDTLWTFETYGQVSASPNTVNFEGRQAVIFGSYDNFLYCVDYKDGTEINRFESGYYLNGAVALWNHHVLFGGCDAWLRVIDTKTGVPTDSLQMEAYIPNSPAIWGNYCYVGDYSGNIYEIYLEKGKISRSGKIVEATSENGSFVSVPALTDETLYILSDDRHLYAINRNDGSIRWKYLMKGNVGESSPVVCADKIIACTKTGIVSILDAKKGDLIWEYDTGEQITASPAVVKGHFYILTIKGTLFCFGEANNK